MRHLRAIKLLAVLPTLFVLISGCGPSDITASGSAGTTGPITGAQIPTNIVVTFTTLSGTPVTSISNSASVNVRATVTDAFGTPISGVTVDFACSVGGSACTSTLGTFTASGGATDTATTNASGVATVQFAAGANANTIASFTATVTLTGGGTINNSALLTIGSPLPPTPNSLNLTVTPLSVNILGTATVTVTVLDASGNPAYSIGVTLSATAGTLSQTTLTTGSNGQATTTFTAPSTSGTVTIHAEVTASPTFFDDQIISITSVPYSLTLTASPANITTSGTSNLTATVRNVLNGPVPDGTTVTFACTAGGCPGGSFPTSATTVGGDASITFTAGTTPTSIVITATAGSVSDYAIIVIDPATTSSIEFVSAVPDVIGIGTGVQTSEVTFLVKDNYGNPKSNVAVDFTLYGPTGSYIGVLDSTPTMDSGSTGVDGKVKVYLHSGPVAGPARIVATVHGTSISTSSGNISVGGGVPSATHFDLSTSKFNLEGLDYNNIQATITAYIADRFGNYNILTGTSVSFVTDSGAIDTSNVTNATGTTTSLFRTQTPVPTDVPPIAGEPNYTYLGRTYNPRDGWATILVYTTGEESFVDNNANGVYDAGDAFTDIGEPFIDSDDDGVRDAGEQFFDWPSGVSGNTIGTYQTGNGVWDAQIPIWKKINLVFTGAPNFTTTAEYALGKRTSRIECTGAGCGATPFDNITIAKGATVTFYVYVSDINMNTLIGGTSISVSSTKGTLAGTTSYTLPDVLSYGPTILPVTLTNQIAETTNQTALLSASITWESVTYTMYYPGTITLTP